MQHARTALPGGAPIGGLPGLGAVAAQAAGGFLGEGLFRALGFGGNGNGNGNGNGGAMVVAPGCVQPFVPTTSALRAVRMFRITNPSTGQDVWYRNAGRPILWSGDFAAIKRVRRVAGKARRKR